MGEFPALRDATWGKGAFKVRWGQGFRLAMANDEEFEGQLDLVFRIA